MSYKGKTSLTRISGNKDLYKLKNFSWIKTTKWRYGDKGKALVLGMSDKEIYNRLEYPTPCFLKKDVLRYAKASNIFLGSLKQFSDAQLLNLRMAQLRDLPNSQRRIGQQKIL